jgi:hypothetical protein
MRFIKDSDILRQALNHAIMEISCLVKRSASKVGGGYEQEVETN